MKFFNCVKIKKMKKLVSAVIATALTFTLPVIIIVYLSMSEAKANSTIKVKALQINANDDNSFKPGLMFILKG